MDGKGVNGKKLGDTVLIVPGFGDSKKMPWWGVLKRYLRELDSEVTIETLDFSVTVSPPIITEESIHLPGTAIGSIRGYAEKVEDYASDIEGDIDIISHSMGGLVSRWFVEKLGGDDQVDDLVTLATPHQGTLKAYAGSLAPACREMLPGSDLIYELNSEALPSSVNYTAVWGSSDHVFFQEWRSKLPENLVVNNSKARNIFVGEVDHHEMLVNKEVFDHYKDFIG